MKISQIVAIAALLNISTAEAGIHERHEFQYYKMVQKKSQSLAQLQDDDAKEAKSSGAIGKGEIKDPVVESKKDVVKAIDKEIDAKTNVEKTDEEKSKDFENKIDDLAKTAEASEHKTAVKALEKEKAKIEEKQEAKAEAGEEVKESKTLKNVEEKLEKAQAKVDADSAEKSEKKAEETAADKEVETLKKEKVVAEKAVKKEEAVINEVKSHVSEVVDPKEAEPKSVPKQETDKVKKFMDDAKKQEEKEEARKEELEADAPKPNPTIEKVDSAKKSAGDDMDANIKNTVEENKESLDKAVKKQESDAKRAI